MVEFSVMTNLWAVKEILKTFQHTPNTHTDAHVHASPGLLFQVVALDFDFLRQGDTARTRKPSVVSLKQMSVLWAQLHAYRGERIVWGGVTEGGRERRWLQCQKTGQFEKVTKLSLHR